MKKKLKLYFQFVGNKLIGRSEWVEPDFDAFDLFQSMRGIVQCSTSGIQ